MEGLKASHLVVVLVFRVATAARLRRLKRHREKTNGFDIKFVRSMLNFGRPTK